ncbi:hypothetical protein GGI23_005878 [Coemansia sp. RSA 2559]|nr:hypothetical protein GGI23_005878 [Coemansia sp. RSA 2559]
MQDCGQPPNELLKTLAPDMELDENGEVKTPELPNCTIIVCKTAKLKCYCGDCVRDRAFQHEWIVGQVRTPANAEPGSRHVSSQPLASSSGIEQLYEYQIGRLQARRQRIAELRARIEVRKRLVAEAHDARDMIAKDLERRKARMLELRQAIVGRLDEQKTQEARKLNKRAAVCQEVHAVLRADRGILAKTLCEVVGLQLDVPPSPERTGELEEEEYPFAEMDTRRRLFGLPWPGSEDWAKYPSDYINACVGHCIHILSVLSHYFHTDLPFYISKRGAGLYIRPNWREVEIGEAELSIRDNNHASFIVGLSMLFFDIAYLCHRQGVRVHAEQTTDAIENLRQAVRAARAKENEARTRLPFMLDIYSVAQEVTKMYVVADGSRRWHGSEDALRKQVNDVLLRLHLCDDAIDNADYEEESWAVI